MTASLTDNLPLLAGAPNGIKKLRELILELAVRGKLVPQDPSDEPASELLKRVADEKARLVAEGKIKKQKPLAKILEADKPFDAPTGWEWTHLGELGLVGSSSRVHQKDWQSSGVPFYRAREIVKLSKNGFVENELFISEKLYQEHSNGGSAPKPGDIMLTGVGTIGVPYRVQETDRFYFKDASVLIFKNHIDDNSDYLLKYFVSPLWIDTIHTESMGTTVHTLTIARANETLCPLPPFAEQRRIVAKIDELMILCDRLETQQADAESAHAQLVQALLDSLTQASDATNFATNWQRLAEHFHTLFNTEPSIDALKQNLLQLAVMGKLVPQDPSDEPASELLRRIAEESRRLVARGKAKKGNIKAGAVAKGVNNFELPANWIWTTFDDLINPEYPVAYGVLVPGPDLLNGVPFVRIADLDLVAPPHKPEKSISPEVDRQFERTRIRGGEILMGVVGSIGKLGIAPESWAGANIARAICRLVPSEHISKDYIIWLLQSDLMRKQFLGDTRTLAQPTLNVGMIRNASTPLPPLAEQHRIVAKIDQLMTLCTQLNTRLTQARQLNEQLGSTLVERALAEDAQQTHIATDRQVARTLLAAEVTHRLHNQRTFGQRKLQKVIYLAEHVARLTAIQGDYLRDAAGPHDRQLMAKVEVELQNHQWYERVERETIGHAYRPLSQAGRHRQAYSSAWSVAERATIEQVIELMQDWDTDHCEMTVTLYAAWNDFILEGRPVSDDAIVDEVMHSWNDTKLRFGKTEWLAVLAEMKKHKILIPTGFGKRTTGGMLSLPGFK